MESFKAQIQSELPPEFTTDQVGELIQVKPTAESPVQTFLILAQRAEKLLVWSSQHGLAELDTRMLSISHLSTFYPVNFATLPILLKDGILKNLSLENCLQVLAVAIVCIENDYAQQLQDDQTATKLAKLQQDLLEFEAILEMFDNQR